MQRIQIETNSKLILEYKSEFLTRYKIARGLPRFSTLKQRILTFQTTLLSWSAKKRYSVKRKTHKRSRRALRSSTHNTDKALQDRAAHVGRDILKKKLTNAEKARSPTTTLAVPLPKARERKRYACTKFRFAPATGTQ